MTKKIIYSKTGVTDWTGAFVQIPLQLIFDLGCKAKLYLTIQKIERCI